MKRYIATENILMEAVKKGGDRQKLHEVIRQCAMEATAKRDGGGECDLLTILAARTELGLSKSELSGLLDPPRYTGRCVQQVENYLKSLEELLRAAEQTDADISL